MQGGRPEMKKSCAAENTCICKLAARPPGVAHITGRIARSGVLKINKAAVMQRCSREGQERRSKKKSP